MKTAADLILILMAFLLVLVTVIAASFRERHFAEKLDAADTDAARAADKRVMVVILGSLSAGIALTLVAGAIILSSFSAHAQDVPLPVTPETLRLLSQPARDGSEPPVTADPWANGQRPHAPIAVTRGVQGSAAFPGWNNPPDWSAISKTRQYASVPGIDRGQLVQFGGREWRALHNARVIQYGGWVLAAILAGLATFYFARGPITLHGAPTGRLVERFVPLERASHWTLAISFVCQAVTGMIILWGKYVVLPWLGYTGFSWVAVISKTIHNFTGPIFIGALILVAALFLRDNMPRLYDLRWLAKAGGMLGGEEPPSGRFNGGEKLWFWGGLVLLGGVVAITGILLDFPNFKEPRAVMQVSDLLHASAAILFIGGALGHIYIGTIGTKGAYRAMREGYVDETWAREHHALWFEEITRK